LRARSTRASFAPPVTFTLALTADDVQPARGATFSDTRGAGLTIRPILFPQNWLNHSAPSGPVVIPFG
jgi:hypothetical protein